MQMRSSIKGVVDKMFPQENPLLEDYDPSVTFAGTTPELFLRELGSLSNEALTAKIFETVLALNQSQVEADCKIAYKNHALYACHALTTTNIHTLNAPTFQTALKHLISANYPKNVIDGLLFIADLSKCNLIDLLKKREESKDDYYINLSGSQLSGMNLSNRRLSNINFTCCRITHAQLEAAELKGSILYETNFRDSNLSRALLTDSKLLRSNFNKSNLAYSAITGAIVESCNFTGANLCGAAFTHCEFRLCLWKEATLLDPRPELDGDTLNAYIQHLNELDIPNSCIYFNLRRCIEANKHSDTHSVRKLRYDSKQRLAFWQIAYDHPCFSRVVTPAWEQQESSNKYHYLFTRKSTHQRIESKINKIKEKLSIQATAYKIKL
jgi:uncharacterized protein YjbI with pentapeptide repeats